VSVDLQDALCTAESYIHQLQAELAAANDLLRWRPMTELPELPPRKYVLLRELDATGEYDPDMGIIDGFVEGSTWMVMGKPLESTAAHLWQWCYIPGEGARG
jgi:hypothetical protein